MNIYQFFEKVGVVYYVKIEKILKFLSVETFLFVKKMIFGIVTKLLVNISIISVNNNTHE